MQQFCTRCRTLLGGAAILVVARRFTAGSFVGNPEDRPPSRPVSEDPSTGLPSPEDSEDSRGCLATSWAPSARELSSSADPNLGFGSCCLPSAGPPELPPAVAVLLPLPLTGARLLPLAAAF